jgi:hypothetical protein
MGIDKFSLQLTDWSISSSINNTNGTPVLVVMEDYLHGFSSCFIFPVLVVPVSFVTFNPPRHFGL